VAAVSTALLAAQGAPARDTAAVALSPAAVKGKVLFKSVGCGKCHTLKAAGSHGTVGPNLDQRKLSQAKIARQITQGGGFMPSFGGKLSTVKINEIAAFVFASTH
jgi:mono/diheme cytochrome c family protein